MSEFLTVRLSRNLNSPIAWLVWSASQNEIIASGEIGSREQLEELSPYAQQRTVIALLDTSDVLLTEVEIPAGAARQFETMLPYLLEEDIAQDVDDMHFSVLKKSGGIAHVAAVERHYLTVLLDDFSKAGIELKRVLPDVFAFPEREEGISALQMGTQWLFRKSAFVGMVVDQAWLNLFMDSAWCRTDETPDTIFSYTPLPELDEEHRTRWMHLEPELVMELLARGAIASPVNLLTGSFKPQSSMLKHLQVWKKVAGAAALFLIVLMAQKMIQVNQFEDQASAYRAESERIFRAVFPDKRKIPTVSYLKRQMKDEEQRLSGGTSEESALSWLLQLSSSMQRGLGIELNSLKFDAKRGEIRIEATMKDFQAFEVVRTRLAEKFTVSQGPLDREGSKVKGSYTLRSKP